MAYNRLSIAQGVGDYLAASLVGVKVYSPTVVTDPADPTTWAIKVGRIWDVPDRQIVAYDVGGITPLPTLLFDWWDVQIVVRADKDVYPNAWNKSLEVKDVLLGAPPFDFSDGTHIDGILMKGDVAFIGYDEKTRPQFTLNFQVISEEQKGDKSNRNPL